MFSKKALIEICDKLATVLLSFQEDNRRQRETLIDVLDLAARAESMPTEEIREELRKLKERLEVEL